MFGFLKRLFAQRDAVSEDIAAILEEEERRWLALDREELAALEDAELLRAAWARICAVADASDDEIERLSLLNEAQKTIYVVYNYECEVNNGGLCQYFVNDCRLSAPLLADSLEALGETEHKAHFEAFVRDNAIDLRCLESFAIDSAKQFARLEKQYPFEAFDGAFYEMPSLGACMSSYIRENIQLF